MCTRAFEFVLRLLRFENMSNYSMWLLQVAEQKSSTARKLSFLPCIWGIRTFFALNAIIFPAFLHCVMTWNYTVGCCCTVATFLLYTDDLCWRVCCRLLLILRSSCESLTTSTEDHAVAGISKLSPEDCLLWRKNDRSENALEGRCPQWHFSDQVTKSSSK